MELRVYVDKSNDHRHLLRLVNEFSPLLSDIYKDFVVCASYKNIPGKISGEIFYRLICDLRFSDSLIAQSGMLICMCKFDIIDKIISEYIEKTIEQQEFLSKSTIDDIKKCHKECEHILKSCIYDQLGKLFIKENIDDIYDKIPNKDMFRVNILDNYMHAIYMNDEKFDLHACARKQAEILIKAFHNIIVEYVNNAI